MDILRRIITLFQGNNWLIIPAALISVIFHEISHGYVAYLLGDKTAQNHKRLTLNPLNHIDPIGLICMIFFGFGWAKPVPINPYYFKTRNRKLGISLVALAGPVSNLILAFLSCFLIMIFTLFKNGNELLIFSHFFILLAELNIGLAIFNFIPVPPLDGAKILFALLPIRIYGFVLKYERFGMLILLLLINLPFFSDFMFSIRYATLNWMFNVIGELFILR